MGNQDECLVNLTVEVPEEVIDPVRALSIQVPGQLVSYDYRGPVYQGSGHGNTRWFWPPESWLGLLFSLSPRPTSSRSAFDLSLESALFSPAMSIGIMTFSRAVNSEVVILEDEAQLLIPEFCPLVGADFGYVEPLEHDLPTGRSI